MNNVTALHSFDGDKFCIDTLLPLRSLFTEYGIFHHRMLIEIEWLKILIDTRHVPFNLPFSEKRKLEKLIQISSLETLQTIKKNRKEEFQEALIYLKETLKKINDDGSMLATKLLPYIHYCCSLEDIDQLVYCIILKTFQKKHLFPSIDKLKNSIRTYALQLKRSNRSKKHRNIIEWLSLIIAPLERKQQEIAEMSFFRLTYAQSGNNTVQESIKNAWISNFSKQFEINIVLNAPNNELRNSFVNYAKYIVELIALFVAFYQAIVKSIQGKLFSDFHELRALYFQMDTHFQLGNQVLNLFIQKKLFPLQTSQLMNRADFFEYIRTGFIHLFLAEELLDRWLSLLMNSGFDDLVLESNFSELLSLSKSTTHPTQEVAAVTDTQDQSKLQLSHQTERLLLAMIHRLNIHFDEMQLKKANQYFLQYVDQKPRSLETDINTIFLSIITVYVSSLTLPPTMIAQDPLGLSINFDPIDLKRPSSPKTIDQMVKIIAQVAIPSQTQKYLEKVGIKPKKSRKTNKKH